MGKLYINCQAWQLQDVNSILTREERVFTNDRCRPGTYIIEFERKPGSGTHGDDRLDELCSRLKALGVSIPMQ